MGLASIRKPIIFLGPSLRREEARTILDADYRPPARRGDVYAASCEGPPLIGLIDGVFLADLPPSPLEILDVLHRGIRVMGASSLGALRAVELEQFGMIGVGRIFAMYKCKRIIADDEVALVFAEENWRPLSEPLINIRYALSAARRLGLIDARERQLLIRSARRIYFAERRWSTVLDSASKYMDADRVAELAAFLSRARLDLKKEDALQLLNAARTFMVGDSATGI